MLLDTTDFPDNREMRADIISVDVGAAGTAKCWRSWLSALAVPAFSC
jgi:hypothetical protein